LEACEPFGLWAFFMKAAMRNYGISGITEVTELEIKTKILQTQRYDALRPHFAGEVDGCDEESFCFEDAALLFAPQFGQVIVP
jgi:hypothetical protein